MGEFSIRSPAKPIAKIKGGGIKGLALAYFLKKQGIPSIIYEKSDRLGGWIQTVEHRGFLFERGPHSFRGHLVALKMVQDLGLEDQLIRPADTKRYLYHRGRLVQPSHFFPWIALGLLRDTLLPKCRQEMSVQDYFNYRLGKTCTRCLIDPLATGIFAGDIDKLSAQNAFPDMTRKGSVLRSLWGRSKWPIFSFKKGMQTLVDALAQGQQVRLGQTLDDPDFDCSPNLDDAYTSMVVIHFGWKKPVLKLSGLGYLIPQIEKEQILGALFNGNNSLSVMMGGAHHPHLIDVPDAELLEIATRALKKHLGIEAGPEAYLIHRAKNAIPQPLMGQQPKALGVSGALLEAYEISSHSTLNIF